MRVHEDQLSLLAASDEPIAESNTPGRPPTLEQDQPADEKAPVVESNTAADPSSGVPGQRPTTSPKPPGANPRPRHARQPDGKINLGKLLEKHYKTRDVAELLSVHEETVLRLAQCGNLRSVRIGSERRYPESAIVEFLERNIDETAREAGAGRRRARALGRRKGTLAR
jgi:excisionase family DNA binding protein